MKNRKLKTILLSTAALFAVAAVATSMSPVVAANKSDKGATVDPNSLATKWPIKHLVVIFNENVSFDHYFATYPQAQDIEGEPPFEPAKNTPTDINNLNSSVTLITQNPNALNSANGPGAVNPFRLDRTQANTADQGHSYTPEQKAYDAGKNDAFPANTGSGTNGGIGAFGTTGQVMGYFDGNTVTALWNYAQNYAMSDNAWGDQYGPSTPGAMNMFAGQTNGITQTNMVTGSNLIDDGQGGLTMIGDIDPSGDVCSSASKMQGFSSAQSIGDLLNNANIPWGSFVGGFNLETINANGSSGCTRSSVSAVVGTIADYVPHHIWFQYFKSTANPSHARPDSTKSIGYTLIPGKKVADPANHAYDLNDFFTAVGSGNFPAVSFIKMAAFQDAHPGNSDPLDEQAGIVNLVNFLQEQPDWDNTAVIIAYDDSDGWYDHAFSPVQHPSFSSSADALNAAGVCGTVGTTEPKGVNGSPVHGRCGPGTRQPFIVISPYAKKNYVSHVLITQASIPQFIEDNWLQGARLNFGSFDATAGSITDLFNFKKANSTALMLDPNFGTVDTKSKNNNNNNDNNNNNNHNNRNDNDNRGDNRNDNNRGDNNRNDNSGNDNSRNDNNRNDDRADNWNYNNFRY